MTTQPGFLASTPYTAKGGVASWSAMDRAAGPIMMANEHILATESTWENALQRMLDLCAGGGPKRFMFPSTGLPVGVPAANAQGPNNNGTAAKILLPHANIQLLGHPGLTNFLPLSNTMEVFGIYDAPNVSFDGIGIDNTANGVLQNLGNPSWYGSSSSVPFGGTAVKGNAANCGICVYRAPGLRIANAVFNGLSLGINWLGDVNNKLALTGDLDVDNIVELGCFCGLLYVTGNSLRFVNSRSRGTIANLNPNGTADAGHLLYVTDRSAGYPNLIQVARCLGQDDCSDIIKVRKGVVISISDIIGNNCWGGMLVENCEDVTIANLNFKIAPTGDSRFGTVKLLEVNDCGTARATNGHFDITGITSGDGYAVYSKQSLTDQTWKNMDIVMSEMTILTDNAQVNDAPVHLENQTRATLRNFQVDNYGTTATGRAAFDLYACVNTNVIQPIYRSAAGELNLVRQSQSCSGTYVQYTLSTVNLAAAAPKFIDADGTTTGLVIDAIGGPLTARGPLTFPNTGTNTIVSPAAGSVLLIGADNSLRFGVAAGAVDGNGNPVYSITGAVGSGTFSIGGGSGVEALRGVAVTSAVNRIEARGAITTAAPYLTAAGADTAIPLQAYGKAAPFIAGKAGTSGVGFKTAGATIDGSAARASLTTAGYTVPANCSLVRFTQTSTVASSTITLPTASDDGHVIQFVQQGAGAVTALTFSPSVKGWTDGSQLAAGPGVGLRIRWDATSAFWYREQ